MQRLELWESLARFVSVLDSLRAPYTLDGGTLLGVIREGCLLRHDVDVDITLLDQHELLQRARDAAVKDGFRVFREYDVSHAGCAKVQLKLTKPRVDVISKHKVDGDAVWVLRKDPERVKRMPAHYYERTVPLRVDGVMLRVPEDAEGYLAARFGPDWRTPKRDWVPLRDDRAYS